jgi:hypothetical protein
MVVKAPTMGFFYYLKSSPFWVIMVIEALMDHQRYFASLEGIH